MARELTRLTVVLLAVKLIQPGMLRDVVAGVARISPKLGDRPDLKEVVSEALARLREQGMICLYQRRRYMLTVRGEVYIEETGIRHQIDARRMFLLKETRAAKLRERSGTRDGSLEQ